MESQDFTSEVVAMVDMRENLPAGDKLTTIEIEDDNNYPTEIYGSGAEAYVFYRICPYCAKFVKADDSSHGPNGKPNATCSKHGRVPMPFVGYAGDLGWDFEDESDQQDAEGQ